MNNKKTIVKLSMFLLLITVLTIGITFAYFQIKLSGIESVSTISVGGSQLEIIYVGTNQVLADGIMPSWSDTKYFNVEVKNTTGKVVKYDINIEVVDSNFYTVASSDKGYMQYKLKKCTTSSNDTCTEVLVDASIIDVQTGTKKVTTISTKEKSGTTYYALDFIYPDTGVAQSQRGTDNELVHFSGYVTLVSSTNTKPIPVPVSFADDSWATIAANVQENQEATASVYSVGSEKEVEIDVDGDGNAESYTVRIANNSHYDSDCKDEEGNNLDSKTACGFVVEFVDIVEQRAMHSSATNVGGWPATATYKYVNGIKNNDGTWDRNNTLYSKLPSDLRSVIIDTYVVSGHGPSDSNSGRQDGNWVSTVKIYLLSTKEVWVDGYSKAVSSYDTAYNNTRQLDYYANLGVTTTTNKEKTTKNYNGTTSVWWLRTAGSVNTNGFLSVGSDGSWIDNYAYYGSGGVAPAFRIG